MLKLVLKLFVVGYSCDLLQFLRSCDCEIAMSTVRIGDSLSFTFPYLFHLLPRLFILWFFTFTFKWCLQCWMSCKGYNCGIMELCVDLWQYRYKLINWYGGGIWSCGKLTAGTFCCWFRSFWWACRDRYLVWWKEHKVPWLFA